MLKASVVTWEWMHRTLGIPRVQIWIVYQWEHPLTFHFLQRTFTPQMNHFDTLGIQGLEDKSTCPLGPQLPFLCPALFFWTPKKRLCASGPSAHLCTDRDVDLMHTQNSAKVPGGASRAAAVKSETSGQLFQLHASQRPHYHLCSVPSLYEDGASAAPSAAP